MREQTLCYRYFWRIPPPARSVALLEIVFPQVSNLSSCRVLPACARARADDSLLRLFLALNYLH